MLKKSAPLLLALAATLFVLALSEGLIRVVAPQQTLEIRPDLYRPVEGLGWAHQPNVSTTINTGEGRVHVYTDDRGFRVGPDGPVNGEQSVLILGDSFMAALQVEYEDSLAGLMEADLQATLGRPVGVRNSGVGAWDPPHYRLMVREALAREPANLVLVSVYLGNDVVDWDIPYFDPRQPTPVPTFRLPRSLAAGEWVDALGRPIDFRLRRSSHFYLLLRGQFVGIRMRMGLTSVYFPEEFLATEADSHRWELTAGMLHEVAEEAERHGVPVLFLFVPTHFQVIPEELDRHVRSFGLDSLEVRIDQPNRLLGTLLRERGHRVVDVLPALREVAARGERPYGQIDTHFNEVGHRVTWEAIRNTVFHALQDPSAPMESENDG